MMTHLLRLLASALAATLMLGLAPPPPAPQEAQPQPPTRQTRFSTATGPLRIGVVGLVHGHVEGLLWQSTQRKDIQLVGICDPDRALFDRLAAKYKLDPGLYHPTLEGMLDAAKPEAVSVMTSIKGHLAAVEACAPRGVHLLVEKPLAFSSGDAARIAALAAEHGVLVLTNYETSWYASVREAKRLVDSGQRAPLRRMVFRHGHKGPVEIGCTDTFLAWLTDPAENGGGALVDFGCYGAALATWLMDGQRPTSVVASATTLKPRIYPKVDDDATIILTYPGATAVVQASWAWTHDNKEMDLFTERGSIHAGKWDELGVRDENQPLKPVKPAPKPAELENEWTYLREVVRGRCPVDPLSSLELNVVVADILDRARAQTAGRP
ncbi:MAG: Gfo/Idh/MocA family oxidoreductase [Phycisphaerales bacterium]|nr:Gfo/Idh/MocA family oxidoreductase [Phycisphaerales bacterium]